MSYTKKSLDKLKAKAQSDYLCTKKALSRLKKMNPRKLDDLIHSLHVAEFEKIDCLNCANCCKTISPAMNEADVRRLALTLKKKTSDFIDEFLLIDTDGDFVFKTSPCPFLLENNMCQVYPSRPKACREYPHTDRKRFYQILELTAKNTKVCPVVFNIVEYIKKSTT